jgi:cell division protease FtsH
MSESKNSQGQSPQRGNGRLGPGEVPPPPPWRVEGAPPGTPGSPGPSKPPTKRVPFGNWWRFGAFIAVLVAINLAFAQRVLAPPPVLDLPYYPTFQEQVAAGNVVEIRSKGATFSGRLKTEITYPAVGEKGSRVGDTFTMEVPSYIDGKRLEDRLTVAGIGQSARTPFAEPSLLSSLLLGFGPTLFIIGILVFMTRRMASGMGAGGLSGIGRSKAKRYDAANQIRVTFQDVAGIDEAEEELVEIVDFLKNPGKYRRLGAMIPKGVLLSGPPGTGKTLLARAVAGEANVPFFSMSASEFVEMIVGVGASRVRDLFEQAKAVAPAIIFIDEIDAIGRSRSSGSGLGGNDEREQTLNQILTEMDGFTGSEGVIVLASTNRPEVLDAALLRPGRFDRRVVVNPPDQAGRESILKVHTKSVPLDPNVDLSAMASTTPGMVGADLKNLVNEAALLAAKRGHDRVENPDFTDAMEKIVLGTERRIVISKAERERTAYHESGHALLGMLQPGSDPVRKISIVPRGGALGVTFSAPDNDRYSYDTEYLIGRIVSALGGRAAEEVVYGNVTTGAESDLDVVTRIAKSMVGRWGMSEAIGTVTVLPGPNDQVGIFGDSANSASPETRALVDREVRRIVEDCYETAKSKLREHRDQLNALTNALLERETLDELDVYLVAGIARPPKVENEAWVPRSALVDKSGSETSAKEPAPKEMVNPFEAPKAPAAGDVMPKASTEAG